jgi:hypothetical protein
LSGGCLATCGNSHHLCDLHRGAKSLHVILLFSTASALTSCRCVDKNANFLRQAVSFASRNGRSATVVESKLLKYKLF